MQTIRKSEDGSVMITLRAAGYSVSVLVGRWATDVEFRGTQVFEWHTIGKGMTLDQAEAAYYLNLPSKAA
jgi:hypothetical protein